MKTILITLLLTCFFLYGHSQSDLPYETLVYYITINNKNSKEKVIEITNKNSIVNKLYCETFGERIDISKKMPITKNIFLFYRENDNRTFKCELKYWLVNKKKTKMKLKKIKTTKY